MSKKIRKTELQIKLERVIPFNWSEKQVWEYSHGVWITETISREELEKRYPNISTVLEPAKEEKK